MTEFEVVDNVLEYKSVEKRFKELCTEINNNFLTPEKIPMEYFTELEQEYKKVIDYYTQKKHQPNLNYNKFNYYTRKFIQYYKQDQNKALEYSIKAFNVYLIWNNLRDYAKKSTMGHLERELITLAKDENFDLNQENLNEILLLFDEKKEQKISNRADEIIAKFVINSLEKLQRATERNLDDIEKLIFVQNNVNKACLILAKISKERNAIGLSKGYQTAYMSKKALLFTYIRNLKMLNIKEIIPDIEEKIRDMPKEIEDAANKSLKYFKKFINQLPEEKQKENQWVEMEVDKTFDEYFSHYLKELYSNQNVFKAVWKLQELRQFLINKIFNENVAIKVGQLKYFAEEWAILEIFSKSLLLETETTKNKELLSKDWQKKMFTEIENKLKAIRELFKYDSVLPQSHRLRIITTNFSGDFTEFYIYELCQEVKRIGKVENIEFNGNFKELMQKIKIAPSRDDIIRNFKVPGMEEYPDVDIVIEKKIGIFVKNAIFNSTEKSQIWKEIKVAKELKLKQAYFAINFAKNIVYLNEIHAEFEKMKKENFVENIIVCDVRQLALDLTLSIEKGGGKNLPSEKDIAMLME